MSAGLGVLKKLIEENRAMSILTEQGLDCTFFVRNERKAF